MSNNTATEAAANLSHSYALLAKVALTQPLDHGRLTNALQSVSEQLSCGSCGNFAAKDPFPDPAGPGVLCKPCFSRKRGSGFNKDEEIATSLFRSSVHNVTVLCGILLDLESEDEDPEVTFSPKSVAKIPPALSTSVCKAKCWQKLKALCNLLNISQPSPKPESLQPSIPKVLSAPTLMANGHIKRRKGCRCGIATSAPGKLTCCGQRCPCYVESRSCIDCKCKGCRNPHRPNGEKRPYPFNDSGAFPPSKIIITSSGTGSKFPR